MAHGDRAGGLRLLGIGLLVVGVCGALVLWVLAGERYDDAVTDMAPAPIGCDTTLEFDRSGTYTLFIETKGSVGEIDGDCDPGGREYDLGDVDPPPVSLSMVDEEGETLDLDVADGPDYDRAGARGSGYRTVDIARPGDYVLTAASDESEIMIRVGRDPADGVVAIRLAAVAVLVTGAGLGVLVLALAGRRATVAPAPSPAPAAASWPPVDGRAPPTAPPYANPPVPPPYATPPALPAPTPTPPPGGWPGGGRPLPPPSPPGPG